MRYDVRLLLKDPRGRKVALDAESAKDEHPGATLGNALELACMTPSKVAESAEDKMRVYRIMQRVVAAEPMVDLEAADVALLKRMIAAQWPAVLTGILFDALEAPAAEAIAAAPVPDESLSQYATRKGLR